MIAVGLEWLAIIADSVAVAVMLVGFVLATIKFLPTLVRATSIDSIREIQMIRCNLGTYLVFALELMIVSDLLHSVLSEKVEDLYFLTAIVVIRTVIAYFLGKEVQELSAGSLRC